MSWLPIYADSVDCEAVLEWLNACPELDFIISDGPNRWKAVPSIPSFQSNRICLWHIPSGPLPLLHPHPSTRVDAILDPRNGWKELRSGADTAQPYFGSGHPGIIWFNVRPTGQLDADMIGLSSFEWIGNYFKYLWSIPDESTEKFWRSLRHWVQKTAKKKIPRTGALDGPNPMIFAFASALAAFERGVPRADSP